ncbi:hypothetical protein, partial [Faecalibaculum rodentium]|uniref:hypothetical protein n=1 Tax=Faecalibaculum rodentium TaxID=1702221 RepID=UPI0026EC5F53
SGVKSRAEYSNRKFLNFFRICGSFEFSAHTFSRHPRYLSDLSYDMQKARRMAGLLQKVLRKGI